MSDWSKWCQEQKNEAACLLWDTIWDPAWGKATRRKGNVTSLSQNEMAVMETLTDISWLEIGSQIQKESMPRSLCRSALWEYIMPCILITYETTMPVEFITPESQICGTF